ncbi:MAG TPA: hypothetical protein VFK47_17650 [Ktedonobacteraceae bacterium]|nr:hypothetical protein [Ktedonobacteraceae bacterium]
MNYFWLASMLAVTAAFLFSPGLWPQVSVLLLVTTSIYNRIKPLKKSVQA